MNKKYLLYAIVPVAIATMGAVAVGSVSANTTTNATHPMNNLVNAIATKFNLAPSDVQQVFDNQKTEMHNQMQQKYTDKINQAVTNGKLTQDQANKIIAKKAELEAQQATFKASMQGKTKAEIKVIIKTQTDALKKWATDNNIPLQYIMMFGGFGEHQGFTMGHHYGMERGK